MKQVNNLKELDEDKDLELMIEFRQTHYDMWVEFCHEKGYQSEVN